MERGPNLRLPPPEELELGANERWTAIPAGDTSAGQKSTTSSIEPPAGLAERLNEIEHCLLLAETVAGLLKSGDPPEAESAIAMLCVEAEAALGAMAQVRNDLETLYRICRSR